MAKKKMEELVIDRRRWGCGKGDGKLLDPTDKTMCCLGFYMRSCGVRASDIVDMDLPSSVQSMNKVVLPKHTDWLYDKLEPGNCAQDTLAYINDDTALKQKARERKISKIFKDNGVKVKYVGKFNG